MWKLIYAHARGGESSGKDCQEGRNRQSLSNVAIAATMLSRHPDGLFPTFLRGDGTNLERCPKTSALRIRGSRLSPGLSTLSPKTAWLLTWRGDICEVPKRKSLKHAVGFRVRAEGPSIGNAHRGPVWPSRKSMGPKRGFGGVELSPPKIFRSNMMMLKFATQITYFHLFPPFQARVSNDQICRTARLCKPNSCRMTTPCSP